MIGEHHLGAGDGGALDLSGRLERPAQRRSRRVRDIEDAEAGKVVGDIRGGAGKPERPDLLRERVAAHAPGCRRIRDVENREDPMG